MIELITSLVPILALRYPGTAAQRPPANIPDIKIRGIWIKAGSPGITPTKAAASVPITN